MGSAYSWKLSIENNTQSVHDMIIFAANQMKDFCGNGEPKFQDWLWFRWSPESKWWAGDFVQELSKKFPETIFRLDCTGDDNFTWFFLNGSMLSESEIWEIPRFPTRPLFKKKYEQAKVKRAEAKRIQDEKFAKAEKEKLEKQINELKAKQQELEKRLAG
jgi:hypothetical protein